MVCGKGRLFMWAYNLGSNIFQSLVVVREVRGSDLDPSVASITYMLWPSEKSNKTDSLGSWKNMVALTPNIGQTAT